MRLCPAGFAPVSGRTEFDSARFQRLEGNRMKRSQASVVEDSVLTGVDDKSSQRSGYWAGETQLAGTIKK